MKIFSSLLLIVALFGCTQAQLLSVDTKVPDFTLQSDMGESVTLSTLLKERAVVIIFYPGDNTPICTKQLCEFRDSYNDLNSNGATILAINPADENSHTQFKEKYRLPFPLLIDKGMKVSEKYGTKGAKTSKRAVYVVGQDGKIIYVAKGKPPVKEVLEALKK